MAGWTATLVSTGVVAWLLASDLPWTVVLVGLASMRYWLGPIMIYFTQRVPAQTVLREVKPADAEVSPTQRSRLETLTASIEACGFAPPHSWIISDDEISGLTGIAVLFQHPETTDVAHLLISGDRDATVVFSRPRSDGSRLYTGGSTARVPWPPDPEDDVVSVPGEPDPERIWPFHRARVERDPRAVRERGIGNQLAFQTAIEMKGVETRLRSGYWQPTSGGRTHRPTLNGAVLMTLRLLAPGPQIADRRSRRALRALEKDPRAVSTF